MNFNNISEGVKSSSTYLVIVFICVGFILVGLANASVVKVDNKKILEILNGGGLLVDIRTPEEWMETGVIESSKLHTFFDKNGRYNFNNWESKLKNFDKLKDSIILICYSGYRSSLVARMLIKNGYTSVFDASGGINSWITEKRGLLIKGKNP
tara:strand:+ start:355 stop:813 length:459 start_codon:yes stop_codon:yes gene_type:complete